MEEGKLKLKDLTSRERKLLEEQGIYTQKDYDAFARAVKSGNENESLQSPRGRKAASGGVMAKPVMINGGMSNKRAHMYSGGGSVKDNRKKK